jgi:alpha-ketoglutarate-dependent taurine dioxygenase
MEVGPFFVPCACPQASRWHGCFFVTANASKRARSRPVLVSPCHRFYEAMDSEARLPVVTPPPGKRIIVFVNRARTNGRTLVTKDQEALLRELEELPNFQVTQPDPETCAAVQQAMQQRMRGAARQRSKERRRRRAIM